MPYNSYYPSYTNPYYQIPQVPQTPQPAQPQQTSNGGMAWVQGVAGAKSYLVAPNTTMVLMDSEGDRFYLKTADASGMPLPLRIFEYKEVKDGEKPADMSNYITRAEFNEFVAQIKQVKEGEKHESV